MLHEIGHIVCGHVEASKKYFKTRTILEFRTLKEWLHRGRYMRLAFERDADMIAAILITQYILQLLDKIRIEKKYSEAFKGVNGNVEELLGLIIGSIYALNVYMHGASNASDWAKMGHPHPVIRSLYIKDAIIKKVGEHQPVDNEKVANHTMNYFDLYYDALFDLEIHNHKLEKHSFSKNIKKELHYIGYLSSRFRKFSHKWSWLPKDEWN